MAANQPGRVFEPVEELTDLLEQIWQEFCCTFDAAANIPPYQDLFADANLDQPSEAAQIVLANMLLEVMESTGRFSPWYTRPARAFGLVSIRHTTSAKNLWRLAPEAIQKWQWHLDGLANAINENYSVLQAILLVEQLMERAANPEPLIMPRCRCNPPRTIQVTCSVLEKAEILCHACHHPFEL